MSYRDEIRARRARLEEMRRQRAQREQEFGGGRQSSSSLTQAAAGSSDNVETRQELDDLISNLVGEAPATRLQDDQSSPSVPTRFPGRVNINSFDMQQGQIETIPVAPPISESLPTAKPQTLSFTPLRTVYEIRTQKPKIETLTFSKGVQTMAGSNSPTTSSSSDSEDQSHPSGERLPMKKLSRRHREQEDLLRQQIRRQVEEELNMQNVRLKPENTAGELRPQDDGFQSAKLLTSEELDVVTTSNDFLEFLDRSSKVVERALQDDYDILADYRLEELDGEHGNGSTADKRTSLTEIVQLYDEKWSKKRMVTDLEFSEKFPELLLASYTKNSAAPYEPDGVLQIWNLHMQSRPEHVLHATSDILTARFHPFHPTLVLGGSYSGQVHLWDTRARSPFPIQSTSLTGTGHTHPVYSLAVVGTQNAHSIITASTDGTLCSWATDMLSIPQQRLLLRAPQSMMNPSASAYIPNTRSPFANDLAVTCIAFPPSQTTHFLAGTEQGPIHLCHRHDRVGAPAGVDAQVFYKSHSAPVMSLNFHNAAGPHNLGDLLLSTGLDWTIRLWRIKTPSGIMHDGNRDRVDPKKPILEIPRDDAIYDAKWSPARPAVFASVDGAGWLDIWDLNKDLEAPVARRQPSSRKKESTYSKENEFGFIGGMEGLGSGRSLNKCAWQSGDGGRIAVGGLDGAVSVFEVGRDLCGVEAARAEEWDGVRRLVSRLEGVGL